MNTSALDCNHALPRDVLAVCKDSLLLKNPPELSRWLFSREALVLSPVYRYVSFLKNMYELACSISGVYDLRSPPGSRGKKEQLRHIGPVEMMFLVNHLYVLSSFDIPGSVLECGASHGYSSCVLSHACAFLNRNLIIADSFEGLPPTRADEPFFATGDYAASLESVSESLANLGRPEVCTLVKGYFCDSLRNFTHDLCCLWMDVDLYESAQDVLGHVFDKINPAGVIFTHEFTDFDNRVRTLNEKYPPAAIFQAFQKAKQVYRPVHLMRYLGLVGGPASIQVDSGLMFPYLQVELDKLDHRWRRYDELKNCNTVNWAFKIKSLFSSRKPTPAGSSPDLDAFAQSGIRSMEI